MSTQTLWIVVAVVVAVLLIAVVLGLVIGRRRRISLRERDEQANLESGEKAPPKGGTYQAGGGFNFASGTATAPERPSTPSPADTPPKDGPPAGTAPGDTAPGDTAPADTAPGDTAPGDTAPGDTAPERSGGGGAGRGAAVAGAAGAAAAGAAVAGAAATAPERERTTGTPEPGGRSTATPPPDTQAAPAQDGATTTPDTTGPGTTGTAGTGTAGTAGTDTADDVRTPPRGMSIPDGATEARTPPSGIAIVDAPTPPRGTPAVPDSRVIDTAEASKDPATQQLDTRSAAAGSARATGTAAAGTAAATGTAAAAGTAAATGTAAAPAAPAGAQAGAPAEDIPSADGRLNRLRGRLSRSRSGLGQSLLGLLGAGQMDEESWEDVEATLLQADLGPEMTSEITDKLREQLAARAVRTSEGARAVLHDVLTAALDTNQDRSVRVLPHDGRPAVVLVVGVNGTGKTTTTGKLARVLVGGGHTVTLGAADTFRAAAAEQLLTWGERAGATVVRGPEGSDPAAVAFDAVKRGTDEGVDAVLLDTAGRLHTKTGLMDELGKVKRVVEKQAEVDEVLLVLDATTGQNGLTQARVFGDVVKVTGIALTKLDGTAKGGIVFRVQRELGVPVKLVGLGEGPDDLAPFEPKAFVDALLD